MSPPLSLPSAQIATLSWLLGGFGWLGSFVCMDLVGGAADALFPLILCDHDLYQRLGNELVERQPNSVLKTRMASALHSLTTSDDLSLSADRSNMRKFRKNLNRFLIDVRGFLRII
ncbi:hypothetical protein CTI12_AA326380 [Artemisia annua]|uniref:Uncharacterized protein n=1 Tax=Artemisia annua TaxID=35608 RepID=A0A2U1MZ77_ARTAN|nr:hypothetical protein CTI12_AA326380 [Artemisia annua]